MKTYIEVEVAPAAAAQLLRDLDIGGSYAFAACAAAIEEAAAAGPGAPALPIYRLGAEIESRVAAAIEAAVAEYPVRWSFPYPMLPRIEGGRLFLGWGRTEVSVRPAGTGAFFGERYIVEADFIRIHNQVADRGGTAAEAAEAVESHPRYRFMLEAGAR